MIRIITIYSLLIAFASSCSDPFGGSNLSDNESKDSVHYILGVQRGRLLEKSDNYKKAIDILKKQQEELESDFTSMSAEKIFAMRSIEEALSKSMKILEVKPMHDAVTTINTVKSSFDKSVKLIKMIDDLEPMMTEYIATVEILSEAHRTFFTFFTDIGSIIPFMSIYVKIIDKGVQSFMNMQVSSANSALFESVADFSAEETPIKTTYGKLWMEIYNPYHEYWSSYKPGRDFLTQIVGTAPPTVRWKCTLCSASSTNTVDGDIEKFQNYLEENSERIYIAIDELRIAHGPEIFPITAGPRSWRTEVGGSRKWRKPQMIKKLKSQISALKILDQFAKSTAETIDVIVKNIPTSTVKE